jgi:hypothetical protein
MMRAVELLDHRGQQTVRQLNDHPVHVSFGPGPHSSFIAIREYGHLSFSDQLNDQTLFSFI